MTPDTQTQQLVQQMRAAAEALRHAPDGTTSFPPPHQFHARNWSDKPHRVVYAAVKWIEDGAAALEAATARADAAEAKVERLTEALRPFDKATSIEARRRTAPVVWPVAAHGDEQYSLDTFSYRDFRRVRAALASEASS